ncbi:MAG: bifunctional folylpolyglutamate synthase/dihydrofolate synthase [Cyclobacteriaceae bacterium]|nr:bifunctional folylpolyglutamate synthase/dihydrofolate synthase [Cyclobacteriaceae bacterium]
MKKFKLYPEVIEYLFSALPMFQRIGQAAFHKDLSRTYALLEALGNPHHSFPAVHVAGTNGKGTSSHMIAAIMQASGYKTGLYTSPHLKNFTERIKVNGQEADQDYILNFVNQNHALIEAVQPSFFEITVAMAFDYFARQKVDIAIVEVGMGGRLDSTNVLHPLVSLITNISMDHQQYLGDTLEKIAGEKAGIIKKDSPVVISEKQTDLRVVFEQAAARAGTEIYYSQDIYDLDLLKNGYLIRRKGVPFLEKVYPELKGHYIRKNIPGVLGVLDVLKSKFDQITAESIKHGLENTIRLTGIKGRWQVLNTEPLSICDTAHNVEGVRMTISHLLTISHRQLWIIWGVVKDKELDDIFTLLPAKANYIFCQPNIPRGMAADMLMEKAGQFKLQGRVIPDVNEALKTVRQLANNEDLIFVGGSTFTVAEIEGL